MNQHMDNLVQNATGDDFNAIARLFKSAILFQQSNGYSGWKILDWDGIKADLSNGRVFRITDGAAIVCVFCVYYEDAFIWREKDCGDAIYLHRIVVNQAFKGGRTFQKVLDWSLETARAKKLNCVRMDTWAENEKLIAYYQSYGFSLVERYRTPDTHLLPEQHRSLDVALLELCIKSPE